MMRVYHDPNKRYLADEYARRIGVRPDELLFREDARFIGRMPLVSIDGGALPVEGIIQVEGDLSEADVKDLKKTWQGDERGPGY